MNALSDVPVYWLNFGLHMAAISALAWIALLMTRDPGRRAFVAAAGVLSILIVPWISAARMSAQPSVRDQIMVAPVEASRWKGWTIRIEDRAPVVQVTDAAPRVEQVERAEPIDWERVILMMWALGTAAGFGSVMLRQMKLAKWKKSLRPISDHEQSMLGSAVTIDFSKIRSFDEPVNPCVVGFFRPCMVIPGHLFESARRDRLKWAVKHEAEHLRAGDSRWAVLLSIAKAIVWWNPVIHQLCASWAEDREKVCDARAIDDVAERKSYGGFLLELAEANQVRGAIAMAANSPASRLRRRLEAIVQGLSVKKESAAFKAGSVICFVLIGLLISFAGVKKLGAEEAKVTEQEIPKRSVVVEPKVAPPEAPPVPLEIGQKVTPFQVKMELRFVVTARKIAEAGSILDEEQMQLLWSRIGLEAGSNLMTAPSVMAKSGQMEKVEIIRANPNEPPKIGEAHGQSFVGVSASMISVIGDDEGGIDSTVDFEVGYAPGTLGKFAQGAEWPVAPSKDFDWSTLKKATAKASKSVKSGETMVVAFEGVEGGLHLTAFVKPTLIDVTGTSVYDARKPIWVDGAIRLRGAILTLSEDQKLPSYWFDFPAVDRSRFQQLWPTRHWERIQEEAVEAGGDTWKGFGAADISSKADSVPWSAYPMKIGVKLTGSTYCELRMILPDEGGGEIAPGATLGSINGIELKPDGNGRRRLLLLGLDPAP